MVRGELALGKQDTVLKYENGMWFFRYPQKYPQIYLKFLNSMD
jgi:hypothetical protein